MREVKTTRTELHDALCECWLCGGPRPPGYGHGWYPEPAAPEPAAPVPGGDR
jgi:hypothetical protein